MTKTALIGNVHQNSIHLKRVSMRQTKKFSEIRLCYDKYTKKYLPIYYYFKKFINSLALVFELKFKHIRCQVSIIFNIVNNLLKKKIIYIRKKKDFYQYKIPDFRNLSNWILADMKMALYQNQTVRDFQDL